MQIIGGIHRKRKLKSPKGEATRPSSSMLRETVFNICQWDIEGALFLDIFAGAGAMGLEALSRGAAKAFFIDKDKKAVQTIQENIALLQEETRSQVYCLDAFQALNLCKKKGEVFDIIFADPPYGKGLADRVLEFVDSNSLLKVGGSLFLEDELDSMHQDPLLSSLFLKSKRNVGRATLRHYTHKS